MRGVVQGSYSLCPWEMTEPHALVENRRFRGLQGRSSAPLWTVRALVREEKTPAGGSPGLGWDITSEGQMGPSRLARQ